MSHRSGYFDRPPPEQPSPTKSRSAYFDKSRASFFGSVEYLGSLVDVLGGPLPSSASSCCYDQLTKHHRPCEACQKELEPVVAVFGECPTFCALWNRISTDAQSRQNAYAADHQQQTCRQQLTVHLENSVRHLCEHQCYLRAFTPYRSWFALQERLLAAHTIHPENSLLDGWKCHLVRQSRPPKVTYESVEDGTTFRVSRQILDHHEAKPSQVASRKRKRIATSPAIARASSSNYPHMPLQESVRSPLGLLEELVAEDPWRLLLCAILLNRTSRVQVDHIFYDLLQKWPSPWRLVEAPIDNVANVLRPLGMNNRRAHGIQTFSRNYLALLDANKDVTNLQETDVKGLFNCGEYAYDAYRIFIQRDVTVEPKDRALQTYVEYKSGLAEM